MDKRKIAFYSSYLSSVVKWLCALTGDISHYSIVEGVLKKYLRILATRGPKEAIAFSKETRNSVFQLLCKVRDPSKDSSWFSEGRDLPKSVRFLRHLRSKDVLPVIRQTLSVLYASRGLTLPVSFSYKTITEAPVCGYPKDVSKYVKDFWSDLGYSSQRMDIPRRLSWKRCHLSTKTGPNGQAMWSSIADLTCLPDQLRESIGVIGGRKLRRSMEILLKFQHILLPFFNVRGRRFRKISCIPDQEGKTRVVAILDYWSQTALKPLHQYLFDALRKVPQDCTFNQGSFLDKLPKDGPFHSVDLTAATDRFPIQLIVDVLEGRLPSDYVAHWRNVMTGFPFETPTGESISYSVGNPMGAYSSWNSFALAHHYVVYYCCRELGFNWSKAQYVILGDDVVICDPLLAKKYMEVLTSLGVEFSVKKTHISNHSFEFAKRFVWDGIEVTPFPVSALYTTRRSSVMMLNVLDAEARKNWCFPDGIPSSMSDLYGFLRLPKRVIAKRREFIRTAYQLMVAIQGRLDARSALMPIVETNYPSIYSSLVKADDEHGNVFSRLLQQVVMDAFVSSVEGGKDSPDLGMIAVDLVCHITSFDIEDYEPSDLISAVPILAVHGQIEELYLKVMREAWGSFTEFAYGGDWKLTLRALTIPLSDQVYVSRNQDLRAQASSTLGKILMRTLKHLVRNPKEIMGIHK